MAVERLNQKVQHDLEWTHLLAHLASRAHNEVAKRLCLALPLRDKDEAWAHLGLVGEFLHCIDADDAPPVLDAPDVGEALAHIRSDSAVPATCLIDVAVNLKRFGALARYLQNRTDVCPKNAALVLPPEVVPSLISLARLAAEIESTFEPDGSIADTASSELQRLRARTQSLRQNLLVALERIAEQHADVLQDRTITLRNDRFVLPVRADAHRPLSGIVHGTSGSGATMFVEPERAVGMGNDLTLAREAVVREEQRILNALRGGVRDMLDEVSYACQQVAAVEVRIAAARLAWDLDAAVPQRGRDGEVRLLRARHPLLQLQKERVVPNDIALKPGHTLLISGPNAGGKTVLLKTAGLLSLMLQAGLPISADPDSTVDIPDAVLSDIGDDQSIDLALSTFSAHMQNIAAILERATQGAVVLLDELCAGTDPIEGAALAAAILDKLNAFGAMTLATTHFDALKTHAHESPRFTNCATGFDAATGQPTYRIHSGVPGASSALETALRYGIPASVIDSARKAIPEGVRRLSDAVSALELAREDLLREQRAAAQERQESEAHNQALQAELARLKARDDKLLSRESEQLWAAIRAARDKVRTAENTLRRRQASAAQIRTVRDEVNAVAEQLAPGAALSTTDMDALPGVPAQADQVRSGVAVYVVSMAKEGTVAADLQGNTVFVAVGRMQLRVPLSDLRVLKPAAQKKRGPAKPRQAPPVAADFAAAPVSVPVAVRTDSNTLDVRGLTADEAVDRLDAFLDSALRSAWDVAFVLHGHGTGVLRNAVRAHVADSPYVSDARPGTRDEGGDGITALFLR